MVTPQNDKATCALTTNSFSNCKVRARERSTFLTLCRDYAEPGLHCQQHPALGGFGPLKIKLSSSHTLLFLHMYIYVCNRDHAWENTSESSWNIFIQLGFIAHVFQMNHSKLYIIHLVHIMYWHNLRYIFFFPLTETKYQKAVYLFPNVVFFLLLVIFFKSTEALNKHQEDCTTSVAL